MVMVTATRTAKTHYIWISKTMTLHMHHTFFHFFAVTAWLQCENAYFHILWGAWIEDNNFLFLFLYFDTVLWNSTPEKFANIWIIEQDGISAIKFGTGQIHVLIDVFIAITVVVA